MATPTVNEGSTAYLTVNFLDKNGVQQTPVSATYEVIDLATGTVLKEATSITAAPSVEITLSPAVNGMLNEALDLEKHRVVVKSSYGENDAANGQFDYLVQNLSRT